MHCVCVCVWVCARECAHACSLGNEMRNHMPCLSMSSAEASPTRETLHYKVCFSRTLSVVDATYSRATKTGSGAARVSANDGAMVQAVCLPWVSGHTDACTHVGGDGDGTDFRLSRKGDGAVPVAAHSLRECRQTMVRWCRRFAYLGLPATPMHARMLAWVDVTRFSTVQRPRWGRATLISKR